MAGGLPVQVRDLENPSDAEVQHLVDVFEAAFEDVAPINILTGGNRFLVRPNFEHMVRVASLGGQIHVATLGSETKDIVGVAIWYGPGQYYLSSDEQREIASKLFYSKCSEGLKNWWDEHFLPKMDRLSTDSLGAGFKDAHWALMWFAVDPAYHRKGVATALMKVTEDKAKEDGMSIVVETSTERNLLIYQRMGFEIMGETTVVSEVGQCPFYQLMKTPKA